MSFNMRDVGGVLYVRDGGDFANPADQLWNFGLMGQPGIDGPLIASTAPNLYDVAPHIQGRWDGKSSVCVHDAARKVLGKPLDAQMQPKGTCFPAGTLVLMGDGTQKPIEDVHEGESVVTHTGTVRRVLRTMRRDYTGDLYRVRIAGLSASVMMTDEHPVYAVENTRMWKGSGFAPGRTGWVEAKKLHTGLRVLVPFGPEPNREHVFDLAEHIGRVAERPDTTGAGQQVTDTHVRAFQGKLQVRRFVPLDAELGRLLGLFLAEGSTDLGAGASGGKTVLTFGGDEELFAAEAAALIWKIFGVETRTDRPKPTVIRVICGSGVVTRFLRSICGEDSYRKRIPTPVFAAPRLIRLAVLRGWLDGDGDVKRKGGLRLQIRGVTASVALAKGMRRLALSCRLHASVIARKKSAHQRVASNDVYLTGADVHAIYPGAHGGGTGNGKGRQAYRTDAGFLCPIKSVTTEGVVNLPVYNLEVEEEHTYVADGIAVHNCGGRTGKRAAEHLQAIMISSGRAAKFYKVSHAWLYALARREYGMLGGGDGVPDGSIPEVMAKYGLLHADESGDLNDYGAGSDDLAAKWGGRGGPPTSMFKLAEDNKVESNVVKVRSIAELMDGYAAGGVGLVSSLRGFTMSRDSRGVCAAQGQWAHYMTGSGGWWDGGRIWPTIDQSWGRNTPDGPMIEGGRWPDYSFAADKDVVQRDMIANGSFHLIFSFPLWDESKVIDWRDI